jgi:hypothetical protein
VEVTRSKKIKVDKTSIINITVKKELEKNNKIIQYKKLNLVIKKSYISLDEK